MPPEGTSPHTLNLFEYTLAIPTPSSERAVAPAKPPALASLSDAQLAQQLSQRLEVVQRRLAKGKVSHSELEAAVQRARLSLDRLVPRPAKQARPSRSSKTLSVLQEGQRKAVQAALLPGVPPTHVAKHFCLSLAAVRKVLEEAA